MDCINLKLIRANDAIVITENDTERSVTTAHRKTSIDAM